MQEVDKQWYLKLLKTFLRLHLFIGVSATKFEDDGILVIFNNGESLLIPFTLLQWYTEAMEQEKENEN